LGLSWPLLGLSKVLLLSRALLLPIRDLSLLADILMLMGYLTLVLSLLWSRH